MNFENTAEPYNDIIVRAFMEILDWDENIVFPEVVFTINYVTFDMYLKSINHFRLYHWTKIDTWQQIKC